MSITRRAFRGSVDWSAMQMLVQLQPDTHVHSIDLPYRLCSWAFDESGNCALWEDHGGQVLAWAALQTPFWAIDYALHPNAPPDLFVQVLRWAEQRVREVQGTGFARPAWFINCFANTPQQPAIEACGFLPQTDVGDHSWSKVVFQRASIPLPPMSVLPDGWHIRPLKGEREVAVYVALHRAVFESESMTIGWRQRTLIHPAYRAPLDLVLVDSSDQLAGFCIGWYTAHGPHGVPAGQIEPMGIRADLRGQGYGQALLIACLQQLVQAGASELFVETDNYRNAAFNLYRSVGFQVVHDVIVYRKDYAYS